MHNNIIIYDNRWSAHITNHIINNISLYISKILNVDSKIEYNIVLSNAELVKQLNWKFRNIDKSTNVLSFPQDNKLINTNCIDKSLGDIIISYDDILAEAIKKNIIFINHFYHILIHGILHLLDYDHINDDEAKIMEQTEIKILANFSIPNPYSNYID